VIENEVCTNYFEVGLSRKLRQIYVNVSLQHS
jgi:hypothetical protein